METFFNIICHLYTFSGEVTFMVFESLKIIFNNFKNNLNSFFFSFLLSLKKSFYIFNNSFFNQMWLLKFFS